jgi:hypothetical protein
MPYNAVLGQSSPTAVDLPLHHAALADLEATLARQPTKINTACLMEQPQLENPSVIML